MALLSCTDNEPDFAAGADHPGTNYLPVSLSYETCTRIANSIAQARATLAQGEEFDAICERMEMLCDEFGTRLLRVDDRLIWQELR